MTTTMLAEPAPPGCGCTNDVICEAHWGELTVGERMRRVRSRDLGRGRNGGAR